MTNFKFQQAKLILLSLVCFAILFVFTLIYAVINWHDDWKLAQNKTAKRKPTVTQENDSNLIAAIADHHLFGKNFTRTGEVPLSNLQISVTGIVKVIGENNRTFSKAYISVTGSPGKIYQTGDILPSGVKIYNITSQEIILDNDGQLEKLQLPREKLQFKPRKAAE